MFLQAVAKQNPELLEWAATGHRLGLIPPDTHVLDLDALEANARHLARQAEAHGLGAFFMAKQLGRNPDAVARILAAGLHSAVCVDMAGAVALHALGARVGHLGHLVQIPETAMHQALAMHPEAVTVFSCEKAASLSRVASEHGQTLNVLLRTVGPDDRFFPGQEGGIPAGEAAEAARRIDALPGLRVAGVTSFPCLAMGRRNRCVEALPNARTVVNAAAELARVLGRPMEYVILPGINTSGSFELLRSLGATHVEPGHAMTGTTPLHAHGDQPERPAIVYVSEVSHCNGGAAYFYAGGLYRRSQTAAALVGSDLPGVQRWHRHRVRLPSPGNIWYYGSLRPAAGALPRVGDTVLLAPRTQLFNVRSNLAVLARSAGGDLQITLYRPDDTPAVPVVLAHGARR